MRRSVLLASFLAFPSAGWAHRPPAPSGELVLDAERPVIDVAIAGIALRLQVDLDEQNEVVLNPAAAARLPLTWEEDEGVDVGRIHLRSRVAVTQAATGGRTFPVHVTDHMRDCCREADGAIGPNLLPYASVRWRRFAAIAPTGTMVLPIQISSQTGLSTPSATGIDVKFALTAETTIATAAAGAILAHAWGGGWTGPEQRAVVSFGIARPARPMGFAHGGALAGFAFDRLLVRISDFAGDEKLPEDRVDPEDVVVSHRLSRQHEWAAVTLGQDRLSRCADMRYDATERSLTLRCAFDRP